MDNTTPPNTRGDERAETLTHCMHCKADFPSAEGAPGACPGCGREHVVILSGDARLRDVARMLDAGEGDVVWVALFKGVGPMDERVLCHVALHHEDREGPVRQAMIHWPAKAEVTPMSDHTTDLRELVTHPNWRWVDGMRVTAPAALWARVIEGGSYLDYITVYGQGPTRDGGGLNEILAHEQLRPDPDDPATLGCMLHLVREAWGAPDMRTDKHRGAPRRPWRCWQPGIPVGYGETEFGALAAALMAAPVREVTP